jgi:hypothetical protein
MVNIQSKNNEVWDMYIVDLEKTTIYNIFTKAWNYRWWKSYSSDKKLIIVSWKIKLISNNWWRDIEEVYSTWDIVNIKWWLAHILYFIEDSEIIEYFPKNTSTKKYNKYYDLKN